MPKIIMYILVIFTMHYNAYAYNTELNQIIEQALNFNPQIKASEEDVKNAKFDVINAYLDFTPSVYFNSQYSNFERGRSSTYPTGWHNKANTLTVKQDIYSGNRSVINVNKSNNLKRIIKLQYYMTRDMVILAAIEAYERLNLARQIYALCIKNEQSLAGYLEMTKIRFEYKAATMTDVLRVEARLANVTANKQRAQSEVRSAEALYERIIGQAPPDYLPPIIGDKISMPINYDAFLQKVIENNYDIKASKFNVEVANNNLSLATSAVLPSLYFQVDNTINKNNAAFLGNVSGTTYSLNLSIPIFQSGSEYININKASNTKERTKYVLEDTHNQIIEQAKSYWANYQQFQYIVKSTKVAMDAAQKAYEGVLEEEKAHTRTSLDVLDANIDLLSAQIQYYQAKANFTITRFNLLKLSANLYPIEYES